MNTEPVNGVFDISCQNYDEAQGDLFTSDNADLFVELEDKKQGERDFLTAQFNPIPDPIYHFDQTPDNVVTLQPGTLVAVPSLHNYFRLAKPLRVKIDHSQYWQAVAILPNLTHIHFPYHVPSKETPDDVFANLLLGRVPKI